MIILHFDNDLNLLNGVNLPIYDVSEDNDVVIMTQPLDFTA